MKTLLFFLIPSVCFGALGENQQQCNDRYGERFNVMDDVFNSQNTAFFYRSDSRDLEARVVFDRKFSAVEVFYSGPSVEKRTREILAWNGTGWALQKEPLGSAMETDHPQIWITPDGRRAEVRKKHDGTEIVVRSPERQKVIDEFKKRDGSH